MHSEWNARCFLPPHPSPGCTSLVVSMEHLQRGPVCKDHLPQIRMRVMRSLEERIQLGGLTVFISDVKKRSKEVLIQSAEQNTSLERWTLACCLGSGLDNLPLLPSGCCRIATAISGSCLGQARFGPSVGRHTCRWRFSVERSLLSVNSKQHECQLVWRESGLCYVLH